MPAVTVRNIPEAIHRALRLRAASSGRSTEAEIRYILEEAVHPKEELKVGDMLVAFGKKYGGIELNIERSKEQLKPAQFD